MRRVLPQRRKAVTRAFGVRGRHYTASLGYYPDGRLGEIFINSGKSGTDATIAGMEASIAASFALQFGACAEAMRQAMPRNEKGHAEGPLGCLLDLLAGCEECAP